MRTLCSRPFAVASLAIGALTLSALQTQAHDFTQTNLVSNIDGLATITDPQLVNPWGVSHSDTSPFWVSNQRQNTTTLYMVTGETTVTKVNINPPTGFVAIPTTESGGPQGPTGQVNNANPSPSSFPVAHDDGTDGASARFIFANLNGTISAWDGTPDLSGTASKAFVQNSGADGTVYTGLAINLAQTRLYAANTSLGRIDVFDSNFAALDLGPDAFRDPSLPAGLVPFNGHGRVSSSAEGSRFISTTFMPWAAPLSTALTSSMRRRVSTRALRGGCLLLDMCVTRRFRRRLPIWYLQSFRLRPPMPQ